MIELDATLKAGDVVVCTGNRGVEHELTNGKEYIAIHGLEPGLLPYRPLITVIEDGGDRAVYHAHRFKKKE